jgi:hypothetical protein
MKEASRESSSRSISSAHREEPELVKETPENVAGVKDTKSSYIWIPPKQQEKLTLTVTKQVEELKSTKTIPYSAPVCKPPVTSDVFGGGDVIKKNQRRLRPRTATSTCRRRWRTFGGTWPIRSDSNRNTPSRWNSNMLAWRPRWKD